MGTAENGVTANAADIAAAISRYIQGNACPDQDQVCAMVVLQQFVDAESSTVLDAQAYIAVAQGFVAVALEIFADRPEAWSVLTSRATLVGKAAATLERITGTPCASLRDRVSWCIDLARHNFSDSYK